MELEHSAEEAADNSQNRQKSNGHRAIIFKAENTSDPKTTAGSKFNLSFKTLYRVLRVLLEREPIGKTDLTKAANINYERLVKYLALLQKANLIEFAVKGQSSGRTVIIVRLTSSGRTFALAMSEIIDMIEG